MADTFQVEIVTPERKVVEDRATEMQIPGKSGYLGILPGHAPLITELAIGEISYNVRGSMQVIAVSWGFAEVLPNRVTILADTAERAEDINVQRAEQAKAKAQEELRNATQDTDYDAVNAA